ncbi:MAG: GNAT family N-acetyltransferase, partial [Pirellulaceae bacterium]|nr:GNAT family N-acetyltransferase [Pirellulaceae bacterium]
MASPAAFAHSPEGRHKNDPVNSVALPAPLELSSATAGDHPSVQRLLMNVFHGPSATEFQAQLEEPQYEPTDRLVVRYREQVLSHLLITKREMRFGERVLPVGLIQDLATAPEFRCRGLASKLLETAERQMRNDGAVLSMISTNNIAFFLQRGWAVCPRHCYSEAGARDILSYLNAQSPPQRDLLSGRGPKEYNIRLWRHIEQAALMRLYEQNTQRSFGAYLRNDSYWRWLIGRRGYDSIYVAIDGPDKLELDERLEPIVGYAAMMDGQVAELMVSPEHPRAAAQLLARACGDAIERDIHPMRIDGQPDHPLHQLTVAAGGAFRDNEAENGVVQMTKMYDPLGFLRDSSDQLVSRARAATKIELPCELGVQYNGEKYRLSVNRRSAKLSEGKLGRSYITVNRASLTQLLLGH